MKAITTSLVLMNLLIFGLEVLLTQQFLSFNNAASQGMMYLWGVTPACITNAATCEGVTQLTLVTNIFLHGGLMHLVFNMIFLASIGGAVEEAIGKTKFVALYFAAGIAGGLAQIAWEPSSLIPIVGASGAISGLMGVVLILAPKQKMPLPIPMLYWIRLRIMFVMPFWLVFYNIIPMLGFTIPFIITSANTAYMAHIGGFVLGVIVGIIIRQGFRKPRPQQQQQEYCQPI